MEPENNERNKALAAKTRGLRHGVLKAFLEEHANLLAEPLMTEAKRLYELAKENGLDTTLGSVNQALGGMRRAKLAKVKASSRVPAGPTVKRSSNYMPKSAQHAQALTDQNTASLTFMVKALAGAVDRLRIEAEKVERQNAELRKKLANIQQQLQS